MGHIGLSNMNEQARALTKVLIVDDDPLVMRLLRVHAESKGFTVDACTDPMEALAIVEQGGVDIIISDLDMPGLTGWDLLRRVRETEDGALIKFIVVSGTVADADHKTAKELGCDFIFNKQDVNMEHLVDRVEALAMESRAAKHDATWDSFAKTSDIFK